MASKSLAENPYEALSNAIILQAVNDYRVALKKLKKNPDNKDAIHEVISVEKFFRSPWYESLTSVDGEFLIRKIRAEIGGSK